MTVKAKKTATTNVLVRLPDEWVARLDRIATQTLRPRASVAKWLIVVGIAAYEANPAGVHLPAPGEDEDDEILPPSAD